MNAFYLHRQVRLCNLQGKLVAYEDLVPGVTEGNLPHAILCDNKIYLLLERSSATYHETIPRILRMKPVINGAH